MADEEDPELWTDLEELVGRADVEGAEALLGQVPVGEMARVVSRLDEEDQTQLLASLPPEAAADLVDELPDAQAAELIERLEPDKAAAIIREMPSDGQADLLTSLDPEGAEQILAELAPAEAHDARRLAAYPDDVAGGLMATEFLTFPATWTVNQIVDRLRRRADEFEDEDTQYVYVVDEAGALAGVLRLRDLLLASGRRAASEIMIGDPVSVRPDTRLRELGDLFDRHAFLGLPVTDARGRLVGVVQRADVEEALGERSHTNFMQSQGIVGGEELRTMPVWSRSMRRLSWLTPNIALNVIAAAVIALYQDTIAAVVALAFFLPIISDMSGCSGNQAIAVSIRELSLGLIKPTELFYVWIKEIRVGVINGTALGLLISLVAWVWQGNPWLGVVVGGAMVLNTMVAVSIGGAVPLLLKRLRMDPALASGPILTTVTDMCGFFLLLSFATALLPRLVS